MVEEVDTAWDSLFSERDPSSPDLADLTIGAPGPEVLAPLPQVFLEAATHRLATDTGGLFQYGPEVGIRAFRTELARFLTRRYGDRAVAPESLVTTCGATSGLQLAATVLLARNGVVFVEDPTYFIALSIISGDLGLKVVAIPMDEQGIDVVELEEAVRREREVMGEVGEGRFWAMVYTIPNYHNPTGLTMTRERGKQLIDVASRHDMLVLCDDVYNLLSYSPPPYSRLRALEDGQACVLSNGSLSKVVAPGLRLGWLEGPPHLTSRLAASGYLLSGGSMNNLTSGIVTSLLSLGLLDTRLDECRQLYKARMAAATSLLEGLPEGWSVRDPGGGYFLWVTGPTDLTTFCSRLRQEGVGVLVGARASSTSPPSCSSSFRLSIAYYTEERISEAVRTIVAEAQGFQDRTSPL